VESLRKRKRKKTGIVTNTEKREGEASLPSPSVLDQRIKACSEEIAPVLVSKTISEAEKTALIQKIVKKHGLRQLDMRPHLVGGFGYVKASPKPKPITEKQVVALTKAVLDRTLPEVAQKIREDSYDLNTVFRDAGFKHGFCCFKVKDKFGGERKFVV